MCGLLNLRLTSIKCTTFACLTNKTLRMSKRIASLGELIALLIDLLKVINQYRVEIGKSEMTHDNFIKKIEDELEGGTVEFHASYLTPKNKTPLNFRASILVAMEKKENATICLNANVP